LRFVVYVYLELGYLVFCFCDYEEVICREDLELFAFVIVGFVLWGLLVSG
jgi:hypothetical protein